MVWVCTAVSPEVMGRFMGYPWPGNVRELAHVIEGAMNLVGEGDTVIGLEHLPRHLRFSVGEAAPAGTCGIPSPGPAPAVGAADPPLENLEQARKSVEEEAIRRALSAAGGNVARASRMLGLLSPQALHYKMKKYGLKRKDFVSG